MKKLKALIKRLTFEHQMTDQAIGILVDRITVLEHRHATLSDDLQELDDRINSRLEGLGVALQSHANTSVHSAIVPGKITLVNVPKNKPLLSRFKDWAGSKGL